MNKDTVNNLESIIDNIKGKGIKIGGLKELLSEELN